MDADSSFASQQTVWLAFYRHNFLHSLLPLAEISRYLRNLILIIGLGVGTASFSWLQRHGKKGVGAVVLALLTAVTFAQPMGSFASDMALACLSLAVTVTTVIGTRGVTGDE